MEHLSCKFGGKVALDYPGGEVPGRFSPCSAKSLHAFSVLFLHRSARAEGDVKSYRDAGPIDLDSESDEDGKPDACVEEKRSLP